MDDRIFNTRIPDSSSGNKAEILHLLRERVKELTALHSAARILQDDEKPLPAVFRQILDLLPPAWQYPEITAARIRFGGAVYFTAGFRRSPWSQKAAFRTGDGKKGDIEIRYLHETRAEAEGPFLSEERYLINSLAEMLGSYAERKAARGALLRARDELELRVLKRTAELERLNRTLLAEIAERKKKERKIRAYQEKLRRMTAELALAEERERRDLAAELHERLGHNLALVKMKLATAAPKPPGDWLAHLEEAIKATRNLIFELGSPVLYELGFEAAVESLAEQFREKHGIEVIVDGCGRIGIADDSMKLLLFKAVRELLHNAAKHSGAAEIRITLSHRAGVGAVRVADNGCGFKPRPVSSAGGGFGLFSIKERLGRFGGHIRITSGKKGTVVTLEVPAKGKNKNGNKNPAVRRP
ncbi:MAG: ATP-binding protein [Elusimicrobiales bacterium]|nr:ATP-binding protein [Elusimicrobiales bacterium]